MKSNHVQSRSRRGMIIPVLGFCLLVLFVSCAVADVVQWQPCSFSFTAAQKHPWWTFPLQAHFVHEESQTEQSIEAYWDGGQTWVVRFAPSQPGRWKYTTISSDPGLNGHSGTIAVRKPTPEEIARNPNHRGHLTISENGRYFQYRDGTPFFLMASTLWAGNTARCGLGTNQDGPFYQYLADRKSKGFTTVLMQLFHGFGDYGYGRYPESLGQRNEGGPPFFNGVVTDLNPEYFTFLDKRMDAIWEHGLALASPTAWFGKTEQCHFTIEDAIRISSYLRVRYGAYNGLWALCGEYQYNLRDCNWKTADINALGQAVQKHNPYTHPLSIHPSGQTSWPTPHHVQSSLPFHQESWLDHHWLQTGQSVSRLFNIVKRSKENRALRPAKPVFCSESYYERASDPQAAYHTRWQAWVALLNGCAGYGYGAFGIWQFYDPDDPEGETGKATNDVVPWQTAIQFQGVAMLKHVSTFFTGMEWWRLTPATESLSIDGAPCPGPTANDITPPHLAGIPNELWVMYIPGGNAERKIAITSEVENATGKGQWYNPRTGAWSEMTHPHISIPGTIPARPTPSDEDWVLVIKKQNDSDR